MALRLKLPAAAAANSYRASMGRVPSCRDALESIIEWTDVGSELIPWKRRELLIRNAARAVLEASKKGVHVGDVQFKRGGRGDRPPAVIVHEGETVTIGAQRPGDPPRSAFPFDATVLSDGGLAIRQPGAIRLKAEVLVRQPGTAYSDRRVLHDVEGVVIYTDR